MISAKIIADSISPQNIRLTTLQLRYPKFIHGEFMTHRVFCLAGDAELEFELPSGNHGKGRRVYKMSIAEFVGKWLHGAAPHLTRWGSERTFDLKPRMQEMRIRQLDEATGDIITSTVKDVCESGLKPVYEVAAGQYSVAGSENHLVMVADGWKRIGDIVIGDALVVRTRKKPESLKTDPLRLKKINGVWRSRWQNEQRARMKAEDWRCRNLCGNHGEEIHHRVPVYERPDLAFSEQNITFLCDACHTEEHRKQGWQTGNPLYSGTAVVDQIRYRGVEPTYDLEIAGPFPNFVANGVIVHNSRNASSSRAIPVERLIQDVEDDPAMPVWWGKNQPGMSAREEVDGFQKTLVKATWLDSKNSAVRHARMLAGDGLHKQLVNRLLEPWAHINVIVTATEFENFFALRRHADAQPEMKVLADAMYEALESSTPVPLEPDAWHLPYVPAGSLPDLKPEGRVRISVARCARVSYLTHDNKEPDWVRDLELCERLIGSVPLHASPAEHQATPDWWHADYNWETPHQHGNLTGWRQYRKIIEAEHGQE